MRATRGAVLCAWVALSLCAAPAPARASDPRKPGLNWIRLDGAESCLSAAQLAARIEARLGHPLFTAPRESELFVDGYVRPAASGWDVTLAVSDPNGKVLGRRDMHFDGEACSAIDDGVALVIAVTLYPNTGLVVAGIPLDDKTAGSLDALFGAEPTDPDPASLPAVPSPAKPSEAHAAPDEPHAQRSERAASRPLERFALDAAGTLGFGQLPGLSAGASAHVQYLLPFGWPLELGVAAFLTRSVRAADRSGRARFGLILASLALCPWRLAVVPELRVCAGAEAGRLRVQASGFPELEPTTNDLVVNLLGSAVMRVRVGGPVYLRAAAVLLLPIVQRRYSYQTLAATSQELYRMPQVAGRAEIGLGVSF